MSAHFRGPAFLRRRWPALPVGWLQLLCFAFVLGRACGLPSAIFVEPDPSDPNVPIPPVSYRSVITPYVRVRPVEPGDWQKKNENVTPKGEEPAHHH
jgi:hypothetical protein